MSKLKETADVAIVGAGVIGLTLARALRHRGVREVMLIERGRPGAEASWATGGILAPQVEADHADDFSGSPAPAGTFILRSPSLFRKKRVPIWSLIAVAHSVSALRLAMKQNCAGVPNGKRVTVYKLTG